MPRLERSIEASCRQAAEDRGCLLLKFSVRLGDPDRILIAPNGRVAFIEFKQPSKRLRILQAIRFAELQELGHRVERVDNVGQFLNLLDDVLRPVRHSRSPA